METLQFHLKYLVTSLDLKSFHVRRGLMPKLVMLKCQLASNLEVIVFFSYDFGYRLLAQIYIPPKETPHFNYF